MPASRRTPSPVSTWHSPTAANPQSHILLLFLSCILLSSFLITCHLIHACLPPPFPPLPLSPYILLSFSLHLLSLPFALVLVCLLQRSYSIYSVFELPAFNVLKVRRGTSFFAVIVIAKLSKRSLTKSSNSLKKVSNILLC